MTVVHTYLYIAFFILRNFIEIHTKQHFAELYRSMLQYYLTDCTPQCCSIIYCLHMKEEQLWQSEQNSALCELQLAAERVKSAHRLSRETHLISPRDLFTDGTVESFKNELASWSSSDLPSECTRGIPHPSSTFVYLFLYHTMLQCHLTAHWKLFFLLCARCSTVPSNLAHTAQQITMWIHWLTPR
jgi:hypothetical protein